MTSCSSSIKGNDSIDLLLVIKEVAPLERLVTNLSSKFRLLPESVRLVDINWLSVHLVRDRNLPAIFQSIVFK